MIVNVANFPFELRGRTFNELSEKETEWFTRDRYLPLPNNHALQIILLDRESFTIVKSLAVSKLKNYFVCS
jgi:hypothetical protein